MGSSEVEGAGAGLEVRAGDPHSGFNSGVRATLPTVLNNPAFFCFNFLDHPHWHGACLSLSFFSFY